MTDTNNGGPAYPTTQQNGFDGMSQGMSLRDWFAGQALVSMGTWMPMPDEGMPSLNTAKTLRERADWAYAQADAMLVAREPVGLVTEEQP